MLTRMSGRLVIALNVVLGLATTSLAGPLTFDHFTAPASGVQIVSGAAGGVTPSATLSNVQGGLGLLGNPTRTITMQRQSGSGFFAADVNTTFSSFFSLANGQGTGSLNTIVYNFASSLNFSANGDVTVEGITLDVGTLGISMTSFDGVNSFTTPIQNAVPGPAQNLTFNILGGLVNANAITRLTINLNTVGIGASAGTDASFDRLVIDDRTRITGDPVPEPASLALFGLIGLGGVVAARRKMRKITA